MRSLLALALCGCSLFGVVRAPDPHCTRTVELPVVDLLATAALIAAGIAISNSPSCDGELLCFVDSRGAGMMVGIGGGLPFGLSALYGFLNVDRCTSQVPESPTSRP